MGNVFTRTADRVKRKATDVVSTIEREVVDPVVDAVTGRGQREEAEKVKAEAAAAGEAAADRTRWLAGGGMPDEFDLLLREAMFAATGDEKSARARTFTTTPRGIQGPFKSVLG
jgi:hypothetical protein